MNAGSQVPKRQRPASVRAAQRAYYKKHRKRIRQQKKARYAANAAHFRSYQLAYLETHPRDPEHVQGIQTRFHAAHPERESLYASRYRQKYPERVRVSKARSQRKHLDSHANREARRRATLRAAPVNDLSAQQWREIKAVYSYRCVYCERQPTRLTREHLTPLALGGSHTVQNVVPACRSCNSTKHVGAPLCPVQPLLLTVAPAKKGRHGRPSQKNQPDQHAPHSDRAHVAAAVV
jgi:hypothetical protein